MIIAALHRGRLHRGGRNTRVSDPGVGCGSSVRVRPGAPRQALGRDAEVADADKPVAARGIGLASGGRRATPTRAVP
jgi:hypothetical protein